MQLISVSWLGWQKKAIESRNPEDYLSVMISNYMEDFSLLTEGLPKKAIELQ